MTEIEIVSKLLLDFFVEMHQWEINAYKRLQEREKMNDYEQIKDAFKIAAEEVQVIYAKYLTNKPRKYTVRGNGLSSRPAYDPAGEEIKFAAQKTKSRIEIETLQKDPVNLKHSYVFLKQNGEWRIDNKKTFWNFKDKWESTII
ncbi:MAG: NTF2 fold immunity protein [Ferruginibacter sp.]